MLEKYLLMSSDGLIIQLFCPFCGMQNVIERCAYTDTIEAYEACSHLKIEVEGLNYKIQFTE